MAEGEENINWRERLASGRARTLLEAVEQVEARGGGRTQVNRQVTIRRAGVMPQNWVGTCDK